MARRRFDPSLARGGLFPEPAAAASPSAAPAPPAAPSAPPSGGPESAGDGGAAERDLTVSDAAQLVDEALVRGLPRPMGVVGQVSNLSQRTHRYFNLKDERSVIQCVMWASRAARAPEIREGDEVRVRGAFSFYAPSGKTSFIVDALETRGLGSLEARFRALCEELRALGWFDESRKPPLPLLPRRIAIITSRAGAALQDCLHAAAARAPFVGILVVDVPVQGEGAAERIARAIDAVDRRAAELGVDAILVTRGGGSREDLWAFNERVVAEAAHRCRTPLVAAIGHEPDVEIIELVAHRAATPTRGIVLLLPDRAALRTHLDHLRVRLSRAAARRLAESAQRLASLGRHDLVRRPAAALLAGPREDLRRLREALRAASRERLSELRRRLASIALRSERLRPAARITAARERIRHLAWRAGRAIREGLARRRQILAATARHLDGIGPQQVLARGYSITRGADGRILRRASDARPGDRVVTRLAAGALESEVRSVRSEDDGAASPRPLGGA